MFEQYKPLKLGESVLVLKDKDTGFLIACEKDEKQKDVKYAFEMGGYARSIGVPSADSAFLSSGQGAMFSSYAANLLKSYVALAGSKAKELESRIDDVHKEMTLPLKIEPVRKRNWNVILSTVGITLTWPLANLGVLGYLMYKSAAGTSRHGDGYLLMGTFFAPAGLPNAINELIRPSVKGNKITNKSLLHSKSSGYRPAIDFFESEDDKKESLDFFGDSSGVFLDLIFEDGFMLPSGQIPCGAGYVRESFAKAKYFLEVDKKLVFEARQCAQKRDLSWAEWRDIRDNFDRQELSDILKSLRFV